MGPNALKRKGSSSLSNILNWPQIVRNRTTPVFMLPVTGFTAIALNEYYFKIGGYHE